MAPSRYERFLEPEPEPKPQPEPHGHTDGAPSRPYQPHPVPVPITSPMDEQKAATIFLIAGFAALILCIVALVKAVAEKADLLEGTVGVVVWVIAIPLVSAAATGCMAYFLRRFEQTMLKTPAMIVCIVACIFAVVVTHLGMIEAAIPNTPRALQLVATITTRLTKLSAKGGLLKGDDALRTAASDRTDLLWTTHGFTRHGYEFKLLINKKNCRQFFLLADPSSVFGSAPAFIANEKGEIRYGIPRQRQFWGTDYNKLSKIFSEFRPLKGKKK